MQQIYWVIENELAGRAGPEKFPWDPHELKSAGVGAIVSLAGPVNAQSLRYAGIRHLPVHQPMVLLETEEMRERFLEVMPLIIDFIDTCRDERVGVLVHCYHGCDRTGAILACYLIAREGLSATDAVERIRAVNPDALSAFGYEAAVETFERLTRRQGDSEPNDAGA